MNVLLRHALNVTHAYRLNRRRVVGVIVIRQTVDEERFQRPQSTRDAPIGRQIVANVRYWPSLSSKRP
jgi:hypothetical protein